MKAPVRQRVITAADEALATRCARGRVVLIDDEPDILDALGALIESEGYACDRCTSAEAALAALDGAQPRFPGPICVLSDVKMPGMDGLALQRAVSGTHGIPVLLMSGGSGAREAAAAFREGAVDFLVKPLEAETLLSALTQALALHRRWQQEQQALSRARALIASLTPRERDVAQGVAAGLSTQALARTLGIAERTARFHRQTVMDKLRLRSPEDIKRLLELDAAPPRPTR